MPFFVSAWAALAVTWSSLMIVVIRTGCVTAHELRGRKLPQSDPSGNFTRALLLVGRDFNTISSDGRFEKFLKKLYQVVHLEISMLEHVFRLMEQLTRGVHTLQPPPPPPTGNIKNTSDKRSRGLLSQ